MTGRVDILWRIFRKSGKKVKNDVTGPENVVFGKLNWKLSKTVLFLGPVTILTFLKFSQKCDYVDPSSH